MHRAAFFVDIFAIRLIAIYDDLGAQFAEYTRRRFIGRTVGAIDNDPQAFQGHAPRERRLRLLDVPAQRVVDADRLANRIRRRPDVLYLTPKNQALDLMFDLIIEFVSVSMEEFDAIIVVAIMRCGNNNAGVGAQTAGDIGDAGRRQRSYEQDVHTHRKNARRKGVLEHVTGKAWILADDDLM